jgi:transposase-like protein
MGRQGLLSEDQRGVAVALFEAGWASQAVATRLDVRRPAVARLYDRWRVRGRGVLVAKTPNRSYSFEFKREVVRRFLAGETKVALAQEFGLSSPKLVETWVRRCRDEGESGLLPKQAGRPPGPGSEAGSGAVSGADGARPDVSDELEQLRAENERLRAEVAFLGKLRALRAQERR